MARTRLALKVDERTTNLSDEALMCRRYGHRWTRSGIGRKRFLGLLARGLNEDNRYCEHGCGATWRQVWELSTGRVLENERKYPASGEYLLPAGSGKLRRDDARVAQFARENPSYA